MAKIKNHFYDDIARSHCVENGHCGECGEDADLDTEAWKLAKMCRDCFNVENGRFGVGA